MTSQGVMRAGTSGLSSHGGKLSKQIFKKATVPRTVKSECIAVLSCLLEAVEANEDPSSFQFACTGLQTFNSPKINSNRPLSSGCNEIIHDVLSRQPLADLKTKEDTLTKSLVKLPPFTYEKLENKLVRNNRTMPFKIAPKAYRNMKKEHGLCKEGYKRNTVVKPDVKASKLLFFVKARVNASMKSVSYLVYVHLNQRNGEIEYARY